MFSTAIAGANGSMERNGFAAVAAMSVAVMLEKYTLEARVREVREEVAEAMELSSLDNDG